MESKSALGRIVLKNSLILLKKHKRLFVFALSGYFLKFIIYGSILVPLVFHHSSQWFGNSSLIKTIPPKDTFLIILTFMLLLFLLNLILFFFHTAIVANLLYAIKHNKEPSLLFGFKTALKNYFRVFLWASYVGTVGLVLNLMKSKKLLHGNYWRIATSLAIPTLLDQKTWPHSTLKISSTLIQTTWGTGVSTRYSFISLIVYTRLIAISPLFIVGLFFPTHLNLLIAGLISACMLLCIFSFFHMIQAVIRTVLYCFAQDHIVSPPFEKDLLIRLFG